MALTEGVSFSEKLEIQKPKESVTLAQEGLESPHDFLLKQTGGTRSQKRGARKSEAPIRLPGK